MLPEFQPRTIKDLIFQGMQDPDHHAIESPGYQPLTYRDLREQVLYGVKTLNAMELCRNDRIAVILPGGPETGVAILTVMAGFTSVPLNPEYKEQEFEVYFSKMRIKAILVKKDSKTAARAVAASRSLPIIELIPSSDKAGIFTLSPVPSREVKEAVFAIPSDIALLLQTSGTTALPKIVPNSQQQLCMCAKLLCTAFSLNATERSLHIVPFYHAMGILGTFLSPLLAGGTVICPDNFVASDFLPLLKNYRLTHYSAGPALHQGILREIKKAGPEELKDHTLRFIRSTSASLPANIHQELESVMGVPVIESYGMSETGLLTVNLPPKKGSVGISVIDSLAVIDENGNRQKPYEKGEIVVQGEMVFSGYENAPDETRTSFIDGWFKTGDIGYLDNERYLYLTGRKSELINKGGEKISPAEIDNALMTHPSVKSAMTFRVNDPVLGQDSAVMVVVENPAVTEEELHTYLIDRLIPFKVPKRIYFTDEIPRGPTGKLLRYVGTTRYAQGIFDNADTHGRAHDTVSPELTGYQEKLLQIWKDVLDITSLSSDDDFFRCGGNSLAAIELLIKIQRAFNLTIPPDTIYRYPTIRQQALMIAQKTDSRHFHPLIVPIRKEGTLPPLFCFHSIGGWIGPYQNIFRFFNQDRPVFGIRAKGLEPGEKPWLTIEEAAREYADAIKTVQKEGPYYLLGYSAGALYAFELACQLQSRGESVVFLGNIDQSVPAPQSRASGKGTPFFFGRRGLTAIMAADFHLFHFLNTRLKIQPDSVLYSLCIKATDTVYKGIFCSGNQLHPASIPDNGSAFDISTYPEKQQPLLKIHRTALRQYQPRTFLGNLTLFSTGPDWTNYPGDRTRGWNTVITGKTIIIDLPGVHSALFLEPFAHVVAKKIEESLKRVDTHG